MADSESCYSMIKDEFDKAPQIDNRQLGNFYNFPVIFLFFVVFNDSSFTTLFDADTHFNRC